MRLFWWGFQHCALPIFLSTIFCLLQGVPIRIEVGPRDMKTQQVVTVRRDTGTKECIQVASDVGKSLGEMLKSMQKEMFQRQLYP